jgi:oxygen-independent coproporphyrinogen III oxidase
VTPVAVYVHTPFCPSKCGYCDFNSYAMSGPIVERTVDAIEVEIRRSPWHGRPAKTVFFGGGTPTFLEARHLERLIAAVFETHPPVEGCEVTSEANPGTVDIPKFEAMRRAGFDRISLGAQSFQSNDLMRLGRVHEASPIARAVGAAREAGFENVNLDLMFALPGQSLRAWRQNLETALALRPEHLSLYCLTIEPNTRCYRHHLRGMLDLPDDEAQVAMYDLAVALTEEAGLRQYEISNFALPGRECRHNLCYWRGEEYAGYGPGAVGRIGETRYTNTKHPERYSAAVEAGGDLWCESERLEPSTLRLERVMLGIRLNEGTAEPVDPAGLLRAAGSGWIEQEGGRVRLTPAGRHFCTEVAALLA